MSGNQFTLSGVATAAVAFAWLLVSRRESLEETQRIILSLRAVRKGLYLQPNVIQFYQEMPQIEHCEISTAYSQSPMSDVESNTACPSWQSVSTESHSQMDTLEISTSEDTMSFGKEDTPMLVSKQFGTSLSPNCSSPISGKVKTREDKPSPSW